MRVNRIVWKQSLLYTHSKIGRYEEQPKEFVIKYRYIYFDAKYAYFFVN